MSKSQCCRSPPTHPGGDRREPLSALQPTPECRRGFDVLSLGLLGLPCGELPLPPPPSLCPMTAGPLLGLVSGKGWKCRASP